MSRRIANPGLAKLCKGRDVAVEDIASYCCVNRKSIHKYLHGRPSPRLEERMAVLFEMTVPQLRRRLGTDRYFNTPKQPNPKREEAA
jgi:hypothetical protein